MSGEGESDPGFAPETATVDGVPVTVAAQAGREGLPNAVFLTATIQGIYNLEHLYGDFKDGYNLLFVNMPIYTDKVERSECITIPSLTGLLVKLLDQRGIGATHLIASGIVAPIGLETARLHSGKVSSLNCVHGYGYLPRKEDMDPTAYKMMHMGLLRSLLGSVLLPVAKKKVFTSMRDCYHNFKPSARAVAEMRATAGNSAIVKRMLTYFGSLQQGLPALGEALPGIETPTLVTWGGLDKLVKPSIGEHIHSKMPNSELHIIENAGHEVIQDGGGEYVDTLRSWLQRH